MSYYIQEQQPSKPKRKGKQKKKIKMRMVQNLEQRCQNSAITFVFRIHNNRYQCNNSITTSFTKNNVFMPQRYYELCNEMSQSHIIYVESRYVNVSLFLRYISCLMLNTRKYAQFSRKYEMENVFLP